MEIEWCVWVMILICIVAGVTSLVIGLNHICGNNHNVQAAQENQPGQPQAANNAAQQAKDKEFQTQLSTNILYDNWGYPPGVNAESSAPGSSQEPLEQPSATIPTPASQPSEAASSAAQTPKPESSAAGIPDGHKGNVCPTSATQKDQPIYEVVDTREGPRKPEIPDSRGREAPNEQTQVVAVKLPVTAEKQTLKRFEGRRTQEAEFDQVVVDAGNRVDPDERILRYKLVSGRYDETGKLIGIYDVPSNRYQDTRTWEWEDVVKYIELRYDVVRRAHHIYPRPPLTLQAGMPDIYQHDMSPEEWNALLEREIAL